MTINKTPLQEAMCEIPKINTPDELSQYMFKHKETIWSALKAAQAYADLPRKTVELRKETNTGDLDVDIEADITNRTLDDILNLLKEVR